MTVRIVYGLFQLFNGTYDTFLKKHSPKWKSLFVFYVEAKKNLELKYREFQVRMKLKVFEGKWNERIIIDEH